MFSYPENTCSAEQLVYAELYAVPIILSVFKPDT